MTMFPVGVYIKVISILKYSVEVKILEILKI